MANMGHKRPKTAQFRRMVEIQYRHSTMRFETLKRARKFLSDDEEVKHLRTYGLRLEEEHNEFGEATKVRYLRPLAIGDITFYDERIKDEAPEDTTV